MALDIEQARVFVKSVDLSGTPRSMLSQDAATEAGEVFDQAKNQAQVVGSGVFSFAQGVDTDVREAISDSALLAQLVANKRAVFEEAPLDWFRRYSDVLQNVGWTLQGGSWSDYSADGTAVEVNEKIIEVMTVALGPSPAALAIITSTVNALKAMQPDSSWLTIFRRESQKGKLARFQIGLVEKDAASDVFVSLLACLIEAQNSITQVLFFKWKQADASFRANGAKVSIDRAALGALGPTIRTKIRAYQADYLSNIRDL
jgi:hypothetical protein